jgi:hypothetical protein
MLEEGEELLMGGAIEAARLDRAGGDAERGQEAGGAVALVGGGEAPRPAGAQRQLRLGAVERLDLRLLVDREWKYSLEAIIKWLLSYFLVHDKCLLVML